MQPCHRECADMHRNSLQHYDSRSFDTTDTFERRQNQRGGVDARLTMPLSSVSSVALCTSSSKPFSTQEMTRNSPAAAALNPERALHHPWPRPERCLSVGRSSRECEKPRLFTVEGRAHSCKSLNPNRHPKALKSTNMHRRAVRGGLRGSPLLLSGSPKPSPG